jgi:hypothetical protein
MNSRFSSLKMTEPSLPKSPKYSEFRKFRNDSNESNNIFRQRPKPRSNVYSRNHSSSQSTNRFRQNSHRFNKEAEFNVKQENFPSLITTVATAPATAVATAPATAVATAVATAPIYATKYLAVTQGINDKPKDSKAHAEKWTILNKNKLSLDKLPIISVKSSNKLVNDDINSLYTPWRSQLIMDNRRRYREELNDIMGDRSPYWNWEYENNDSDDEYSEDEGIYTDEDEYVLDEW